MASQTAMRKLSAEDSEPEKGIEIEQYPFGRFGLILFGGGTVLGLFLCAFAILGYFAR